MINSNILILFYFLFFIFYFYFYFIFILFLFFNFQLFITVHFKKTVNKRKHCQNSNSTTRLNHSWGLQCVELPFHLTAHLCCVLIWNIMRSYRAFLWRALLQCLPFSCCVAVMCVAVMSLVFMVRFCDVRCCNVFRSCGAFLWPAYL